MFKLRSIASRLILAISLTVAAACAVLGTFSVLQQRSLKQLALEQQLKLQYDSVTAAVDYEGRAAFRALYPELRYSGNRAILLDAKAKLPTAALRHCVALA